MLPSSLNQEDWIIASNQVKPSGNYVILELTPATWYKCRITAHNNAGTSVAEYEIATLALTGVPQPPKIEVISTATNKIDVQVKPTTADDTTPILGYTLYYKPDFSNWKSVTLSASISKYRLTDLRCGSNYKIYATAFNKIGTSEPSHITNTSTMGMEPIIPEIEEFIEVSTMAITFHLNAWDDGGCPIHYFVIEYRERNQEDWIIASNQVKPSGNYVILELTPATWYKCRITAHNNAGTSVAEYEIATLALTGAPQPPKIEVISTATNKIDVQMKPTTTDNTTPILGYTLHYKPDFSDWESVTLSASISNCSLTDLQCGSHYKIYATAFNKIGTSEPSHITNTSTMGMEPIIPEIEEFIEVSSMAITFHLNAWDDGGCPIHYFVIEYRERNQEDWIMASTQVKPLGNYVILELTPTTWYKCRITAHNNAGTSVAEYEIATLAVTGAPQPPKIEVISTATNKIDVQVKPTTADDTTAILGYTLYYKPDFSDWESVTLSASISKYSLTDLQCGSHYKIYATAYNKIGTGEPSRITNISTMGIKSEAPEWDQFIAVSTKFIILDLNAWGDGGCPINYFVIEQKKRHQKDWTMESSPMRPSGYYKIFNLTPNTKYQLRISAYNNVGSTVATYKIKTLALTW
ncbi:cell adhesion molecule Dscam1-like [Oratosquilla oratoria]|uniref:cell adhesion molecule Dscam1-like n=1 Tax=Oratosquilla oratoria TaxID=337810 RepID=UPI003F76B35F